MVNLAFTSSQVVLLEWFASMDQTKNSERSFLSFEYYDRKRASSLRETSKKGFAISQAFFRWLWYAFCHASISRDIMMTRDRPLRQGDPMKCQSQLFSKKILRCDPYALSGGIHTLTLSRLLSQKRSHTRSQRSSKHCSI